MLQHLGITIGHVQKVYLRHVSFSGLPEVVVPQKVSPATFSARESCLDDECAQIITASFQKLNLEKMGPAPGTFELSKGVMK